MKVRPIFAWYDAWVGFFWDRTKRKLYIFPLPFIGIVLEFTPIFNTDQVRVAEKEKPND